MPTGYTAGILDDSIKTFEEYATACIRAFGASIHMRDEPMNKSLEARKPSTYHKDIIESLRKEKILVEKLTDAELIKERKDQLEEEIRRYKNSIKKVLLSYKKLSKMREKAIMWTPPTQDHNGYKEFMIQQLDETIKWDGDPSYYQKELEKSQDALKEKFDPNKERERRKMKIEEQIEYHEKAYDKELKSCDHANEWTSAVLRTFKKRK